MLCERCCNVSSGVPERFQGGPILTTLNVPNGTSQQRQKVTSQQRQNVTSQQRPKVTFQQRPKVTFQQRPKVTFQQRLKVTFQQRPKVTSNRSQNGTSLKPPRNARGNVAETFPQRPGNFNAHWVVS